MTNVQDGPFRIRLEYTCNNRKHLKNVQEALKVFSELQIYPQNPHPGVLSYNFWLFKPKLTMVFNEVYVNMEVFFKHAMDPKFTSNYQKAFPPPNTVKMKCVTYGCANPNVLEMLKMYGNIHRESVIGSVVNDFNFSSLKKKKPDPVVLSCLLAPKKGVDVLSALKKWSEAKSNKSAMFHVGEDNGVLDLYIVYSQIGDLVRHLSVGERVLSACFKQLPKTSKTCHVVSDSKNNGQVITLRKTLECVGLKPIIVKKFQGFTLHPDASLTHNYSGEVPVVIKKKVQAVAVSDDMFMLQIYFNVTCNKEGEDFLWWTSHSRQFSQHQLDFPHCGVFSYYLRKVEGDVYVFNALFDSELSYKKHSTKKKEIRDLHFSMFSEEFGKVLKTLVFGNPSENVMTMLRGASMNPILIEMFPHSFLANVAFFGTKTDCTLSIVVQLKVTTKEKKGDRKKSRKRGESTMKHIQKFAVAGKHSLFSAIVFKVEQKKGFSIEANLVYWNENDFVRHFKKEGSILVDVKKNAADFKCEIFQMNDDKHLGELAEISPVCSDFLAGYSIHPKGEIAFSYEKKELEIGNIDPKVNGVFVKLRDKTKGVTEKFFYVKLAEKFLPHFDSLFVDKMNETLKDVTDASVQMKKMIKLYANAVHESLCKCTKRRDMVQQAILVVLGAFEAADPVFHQELKGQKDQWGFLMNLDK